MIPFCILLVNWYWGRWSDHGFKKRTNKKKKKERKQMKTQQLGGKQSGVRIPRLTRDNAFQGDIFKVLNLCSTSEEA